MLLEHPKFGEETLEQLIDSPGKAGELHVVVRDFLAEGVLRPHVRTVHDDEGAVAVPFDPGRSLVAGGR